MSALALISACAAPAAGPAPGNISLAPDNGGLSVEGTGLRIDFGRSPEGVIAALDRELGRGRALALGGCPAGVVRQIAWGDLVLTFTDERFVGWQRDGASAGKVCHARV